MLNVIMLSVVMLSVMASLNSSVISMKMPDLLENIRLRRKYLAGRQDTQHNDIQHNDTQHRGHRGLICDV
jgi:hypothetical protein